MLCKKEKSEAPGRSEQRAGQEVDGYVYGLLRIGTEAVVEAGHGMVFARGPEIGEADTVGVRDNAVAGAVNDACFP